MQERVVPQHKASLRARSQSYNPNPVPAVGKAGQPNQNQSTATAETATAANAQRRGFLKRGSVDANAPNDMQTLAGVLIEDNGNDRD